MSMVVTSQSGELYTGKEYDPHCPDALHTQLILWPMSVAPKQIPPERKEGGVEQSAPPPQISPCGFECVLPGLETTQRSAADPCDQCGGQDHHRGNPQARKQS